MTKKKLSSKTQFISFLSLSIIVLALFALINLVGSPTKLFSNASSDKDFGFAAKIQNSFNNSENSNSSYISFNGGLFSPQKGYTIETWFKPSLVDFSNKYLFSYQQNDDPLAILVSSYPTGDNLYDMNFQAFVGEDFDGVCGQQSQDIKLTNLSESEVVAWKHVAITINSRGDWNFFVNGKKSDDQENIEKLCQTHGNFLVGAGWKDAIATLPMEIDELRVSNKVRYDGNFTPQVYPFEKDLNTLVLFDFNKNLKSLVDSDFEGKAVGEIEYVKNFYSKK